MRPVGPPGAEQGRYLIYPIGRWVLLGGLVGAGGFLRHGADTLDIYR